MQDYARITSYYYFLVFKRKFHFKELALKMVVVDDSSTMRRIIKNTLALVQEDLLIQVLLVIMIQLFSLQEME